MQDIENAAVEGTAEDPAQSVAQANREIDDTMGRAESAHAQPAMAGFAWMTATLSVATPDELPDKGIKVYHAPDVPEHIKVVNLVNGRVVQFPEVGELPPADGYYADYDDLTHYCEQGGTPLVDMGGAMAAPTNATPAEQEREIAPGVEGAGASPVEP